MSHALGRLWCELVAELNPALKTGNRIMQRRAVAAAFVDRRSLVVWAMVGAAAKQFRNPTAHGGN